MAQLFLYVDPSSGKYVYYDTATSKKSISDNVPTQADITLSYNSLYLKPGVTSPDPVTGLYTYVDSETGNMVVTPNPLATSINQIIKTASVESAPATTDAKKGDSKTEDKKLDGTSSDEDSGDSENVQPPEKVKADNIQEAGTNDVSVRTYNPLRDFSSVTYKIGFYALTPDAYNAYFDNNNKWNLKDLSLIAQSGGSANEVGQNRNKYFDLDFYIDDLEIVTLTNAKETGFSGNQQSFRFKVYEPYGLTFPSRLVQAEKDIQQQANISHDITNQLTALACHFLIVVRFYGYDKNGDVITTTADTNPSNVDDTAAFERAFPVVIKKFNFKLDNKVTVYDIEAVMANQQIGYGAKRGIIKAGATIKADTVGNALDSSTNENTDKAIKGLVQALNDEQTELTKGKNPQQAIADTYAVVFEDNSSIADALIVEKNWLKSTAPMAFSANESGVNVKLEESAKGKIVDKKVRDISIPPGTTILTAIDQIITQSTYTLDALKAIDSEETQQPQENDDPTTVNPNPSQLYWYHVTPQARVIDWDSKRNDFAYAITYLIQKYEVPYVRSVSIGNTTSYKGPSKKYWYYYTGKNTEILNYEQQYNMLYFNTASMSSDVETKTSKNDSTPNTPTTGRDANPTGLAAGAFELPNTIKTFLYSPGDQIHAQIKILGDPDYLMTTVSGSKEEAFKKWRGEDATINPSSGQVFIEVDFNQVEDYDPDTGLMKPNHNIAFWDYPPEIQKVTKGAMVYMLIKVTSHFTKGMFTQELKTVLPNFPNISSSDSSTSQRGKAADSANQSDAETARLTRQNTQASIPPVVKSLESGNGPTQIPTGGLENIANQAKAAAGAASSTVSSAYDIMGNATGLSANDDAGASNSASTVKPDNSRGFFSNLFTPNPNMRGRGAVRTYSNK